MFEHDLWDQSKFTPSGLGFMSKDMYMMMRELPMVIDHYLHRYMKLKEIPSESADEDSENGS